MGPNSFFERFFDEGTIYFNHGEKDEKILGEVKNINFIRGINKYTLFAISYILYAIKKGS